MAEFIPEDEWTPALRSWRSSPPSTAGAHPVRHHVRFEKGRMTSRLGGQLRRRELTFNYERLGKSGSSADRARTSSLLIHEFAHQKASNHLSTDFYHELQRLGAKSTDLALRDPEFFLRHGYRRALTMDGHAETSSWAAWGRCSCCRRSSTPRYQTHAGRADDSRPLILDRETAGRGPAWLTALCVRSAPAASRRRRPRRQRHPRRLPPSPLRVSC